MCRSFYWERRRSQDDTHNKSCARDPKTKDHRTKEVSTTETGTSRKHAKCYCASSIPIQPELFEAQNSPRNFVKKILCCLSFFLSLFCNFDLPSTKSGGSSNDRVIKVSTKYFVQTLKIWASCIVNVQHVTTLKALLLTSVTALLSCYRQHYC